MTEPRLTIRVTGLGHKVTLKGLPAASTTVSDLRIQVYEATGLPPRFQKFVGPQKLNINCYQEHDANYDGSLATKTLADLGMKDRTKLMLLHSPIYQAEKDIYEKLLQVQGDIQELATSIKSQTSQVQKQGFVSEMVTRICCRLDAIDVAGSKNLRAQRKELLRKAEELEGLAEREAAKQTAEC